MRQLFLFWCSAYGNADLSLWMFLEICRNADGWIYKSTPVRSLQSIELPCVNWAMSWDRALLHFFFSPLDSEMWLLQSNREACVEGKLPRGVLVFLHLIPLLQWDTRLGPFFPVSFSYSFIYFRPIGLIFVSTDYTIWLCCLQDSCLPCIFIISWLCCAADFRSNEDVLAPFCLGLSVSVMFWKQDQRFLEPPLSLVVLSREKSILFYIYINFGCLIPLNVLALISNPQLQTRFIPSLPAEFSLALNGAHLDVSLSHCPSKAKIASSCTNLKYNFGTKWFELSLT